VGTDNNATFGALSIAQGGILYLDNLDRMPVEFQEEFARVLADGSYDRRGDGKAMVSNFQLVASLPAPLDKVMGDGGMCPALRGRLMGVEIRLLPLRMRSFEFKPIIKIFFARRGQTPSEQVVGELADFCKRYYWQGNIRELFSYLELVTLLHDDALSRLDFSCMPTVASMFPPPEAGETAIDARTSTRAAVASAELSDGKAAATVHGGTWREVVSQAAPSSSAANASDPRPVGAAQAKIAAHSALHLLSDALARDVPIYDVLAFVEKEILSEAIRRHGMNMSHVCAALRMPRSTLNLKRRHYGLP
jgi:DNA-binding NtrC family response regulator